MKEGLWCFTKVLNLRFVLIYVNEDRLYQQRSRVKYRILRGQSNYSNDAGTDGLIQIGTFSRRLSLNVHDLSFFLIC